MFIARGQKSGVLVEQVGTEAASEVLGTQAVAHGSAFKLCKQAGISDSHASSRCERTAQFCLHGWFVAKFGGD